MPQHIELVGLLLPIISVVAGYLEAPYEIFAPIAATSGTFVGYLMKREHLVRISEGKTSKPIAYFVISTFILNALIWSLFYGLGSLFN